MAEALWDVDEVARFQRLAGLAPHLMTYEEQRIWSTLCKFLIFGSATGESGISSPYSSTIGQLLKRCGFSRCKNIGISLKLWRRKADAGVLPKMEVLRLKQEVVDD